MTLSNLSKSELEYAQRMANILAERDAAAQPFKDELKDLKEEMKSRIDELGIDPKRIAATAKLLHKGSDAISLARAVLDLIEQSDADKSLD